jgi:3'-phosphoadenosine 5'-phosphosulfate sulfotransferase (PAPS reductase)/FAD synthetase
MGELVARGATFVVNHSGGKDSQAMFHYVHANVPAAQIVVVHAVLPEVEWDGVEEHVRGTTLGVPVHTCRSRRTLLEMIAERGMFPSPSQRQCTSDLKRGPIERTIRGLGVKLIVNCMGMRAEESSSRAKLVSFKFSERNSKAGREWYDWLPIHDWTVGEVFAHIREVGQKPHWAYEKGMTRLSCCFCIMASRADLTTAAKLNPSLYRKYVELERSTGQVMLMPSKTKGRQTLEDVTGIRLAA